MNKGIETALTFLGIKKKKTFGQKLMSLTSKKALVYGVAGLALVYGAGKYGVPYVARTIKG